MTEGGNHFSNGRWDRLDERTSQVEAIGRDHEGRLRALEDLRQSLDHLSKAIESLEGRLVAKERNDVKWFVLGVVGFAVAVTGSVERGIEIGAHYFSIKGGP